MVVKLPVGSMMLQLVQGSSWRTLAPSLSALIMCVLLAGRAEKEPLGHWVHVLGSPAACPKPDTHSQ